jgi:putative endonuclease
MNQQEYYVFMMTNQGNTVIYTGITNDLARRFKEHRDKINPDGFTAKYNVNKLVYYEVFDNPNDMINREKQIKAGSRSNKIKLIKSINPEFKDLNESLKWL